MPVLELLVGPIASGKSTYCKTKINARYLIVNDDAIVNMVHNNNYQAYDKKLKPLYKNIEHEIISAAATNKYNVIVDRPNYSAAMRRRYIGLAKSYDMDVHIIMFNRSDPVIHAFRRLRADNRGYDLNYWHRVAEYHQERYEEPDKEKEGFDRIFFFNFEDNSLYDLELETSGANNV